MNAMLRAMAMSLASSVLAAACALVEQPPPPGTTPIQVEIRNQTEQTVVELFVVMEDAEGTLDGAARPASVPPKSTIDVTVYVPTARAWTIFIGPTGSGVTKADLEEAGGQGCRYFIELSDSLGGFALGHGCE
jgi:hypothetical protein